MAYHGGKSLITDNKTDYLLDYLVNVDKFNEQMRPSLDALIEKRADTNSDLDKLKENPDNGIISISPDSPLKIRTDRFQSPYREKIEGGATTRQRTEPAHIPSPYRKATTIKQASPYQERIDPVHIPTPIKQQTETPLEKRESAKERRARAREAYFILEDMRENKGVKLSRRFTPDDDPDEMEEEIEAQKNMRTKQKKLNFCKRVLIDGAGLLEFLNDNYNPFDFEMDGFSKHIAAESDDYTDIFEELIAKYSSNGSSNFPPEIRLVVMLIMSGAGFHMSKKDTGLGNMLKGNPGLTKAMFGMIGGGGPEEEEEEPAPDNDAILSQLRNNRKQRSPVPDMALNEEREKRLLAEQKLMFEQELRKQQEVFAMQLNEMNMKFSRQLSPVKHEEALSDHPPPAYPSIRRETIKQTSPQNVVLSDINTKPRFMQNNYHTYMTTEIPDVFTEKRRALDSVLDSLDQISDDIFKNSLKLSDPHTLSISKRNGVLRI